MFSHAAPRLIAKVSIAISIANAASLPTCANTSPQYDYVVVGSGVGGGPLAARLAENGFTVLVVDAGQDVLTVNTTIPLYFGRAVEDPAIELNYTYNEYSPGAPFPRDGDWYPRARALGGSTIHNAMLHNIADTMEDFNNLATMFNDPTWSYTNMRNYFKLIEDDLSLNSSDPDHGFKGWLKTSTTPASLSKNITDPQFLDIVNTIFLSGPFINDTNSVANVNAIGVGNPSFTIDENRNRTSVRSRLTDVQVSTKGKLSFSFNTIATKIQLCADANNFPTAFGVEIAVGGALPVASNFDGKGHLNTTLVTVKHEVIVSAGVFQSPQLLMLSGIGNATELTQVGITPVVDLPGVGTNLQDHDEVATVWSMKENYTLLDGCTFLYTTETDPCLKAWETSGHQNVYAFGPALFTIMAKSISPILQTQPDLFTYWLPGYFQGFFHGFGQKLADTHNALTAVVLKAHPSSRGSVTLTGSDPQDPLHIEKRHFEAADGQDDINAIITGMKSAWDLANNANITKHVEARVFPDASVVTDKQIQDHILQNVFGHHACCTNKMGVASDPMAVLDGNLTVRGVANLRVVDISSWPTIPGFFVATPTYMMSEKAADVIIAAAKNAIIPRFGQCGGQGFTITGTCVPGTACVFFDTFFSQCL